MNPATFAPSESPPATNLAPSTSLPAATGYPASVDLVASDRAIGNVDTPALELTQPAATRQAVRHQRTRDDRVGVLLVEDLPQIAEHVRTVISGLDKIDVLETVNEAALVPQRIGELEPDVLIIDALLQGQHSGIDVAKRIRDLGIDLPIIMTTIPRKPLAAGKGMGIIETITMPITPEALGQVIARVDEAYRGPIPARLTGIHALYSGNGGVGRTTLAYNLAVAAARTRGTRVALLDGDLQFGGLRLLLEPPAETPCILQLPTDHITADDLRAAMWTVDAGIDVLLAPEHLEEADLVTPRDLKATLRLMKDAYDLVIVDAPTMLVDTTLALLDNADSVVFVATPARASLVNVARSMRALVAAGYRQERLKVVLNKAGMPGLSPDAARSVVGRDVDAVVPFEPLLADATRADLPGVPIIDAHPDAPGSRALSDLVGVLAAARPDEA